MRRQLLCRLLLITTAVVIGTRVCEAQVSASPGRTPVAPTMTREEGSWRISTSFFETDPHRTYAGWDQGIWRSLEKGIVGVGMSKAMVEVACGEPTESGVVVTNNRSNPIYTCSRYDNGGRERTFLLMDRDKVSKVAKSLHPATSSDSCMTSRSP